MGYNGSNSNPSYSIQMDYDGSGNMIYMGLAEPNTITSDSYWQIKRFTYSGSGNLLSTTWADGNRNFDNIWDNRTDISYS